MVTTSSVTCKQIPLAANEPPPPRSASLGLVCRDGVAEVLFGSVDGPTWFTLGVIRRRPVCDVVEDV
jgi:hypothetical protein